MNFCYQLILRVRIFFFTSCICRTAVFNCTGINLFAFSGTDCQFLLINQSFMICLATAQFNVVPKNPDVQGVRNESLNLEWNFINILPQQSVINAHLYFNETNFDNPDSQNVICIWLISDQKPMVTRGKVLFPGRIF